MHALARQAWAVLAVGALDHETYRTLDHRNLYEFVQTLQQPMTAFCFEDLTSGANEDKAGDRHQSPVTCKSTTAAECGVSHLDSSAGQI